jgi:UrcA family protein
MKTTISATHLIAAAVIGSAFAVGFLSGPAFAEPDSTKPFEFSFKYDPSELKSEEGAKTVLARLQQSVTRQCTSETTGSRLKLTEKARACINETMAKSVANIGNSTLAQAYKSRADG